MNDVKQEPLRRAYVLDPKLIAKASKNLTINEKKILQDNRLTIPQKKAALKRETIK